MAGGVWAAVALAYAYIAAWITMSAVVIMFNKCASLIQRFVTDRLSVGTFLIFIPEYATQMGSVFVGIPLPHHTDDVAHGLLLGAVVPSGEAQVEGYVSLSYSHRRTGRAFAHCIQPCFAGPRRFGQVSLREWTSQGINTSTVLCL